MSSCFTSLLTNNRSFQGRSSQAINCTGTDNININSHDAPLTFFPVLQYLDVSVAYGINTSLRLRDIPCTSVLPGGPV